MSKIPQQFDTPSAKTPAKVGNSATIGTRPVKEMSGTENLGTKTVVHRTTKTA